jgi:glycosyltransferase involved in cell wall biosynthesis
MKSMDNRPLVAFYAPMKSPDHPVPSGDRTVARLYMKALEEAGFHTEIATNLRIFDPSGAEPAQTLLLLAADEMAWRLVSLWGAKGARRPDLWFTYHVYHKSPDLIGPLVCEELDIPYVIAEPSHAPKRREGPWARLLARSGKAIRRADRVFVATQADAECVAPLRDGRGGMVMLAPFLDPKGWPGQEKGSRNNGIVHLVSVAMMRPGDKLASYRLLAEALGLIENLDWRLTIVGDGEARPEVERAFARLGTKVRFAGAVKDRRALGKLLSENDIFVWPAVNEAYGMAPLEASLMGLPVVLGDEGGVRAVVQDGVTGLLSPKRDAKAFAENLKRLIQNRNLAQTLGRNGRRFVLEERSLEHAARILRLELFPLLNQKVP